MSDSLTWTREGASFRLVGRIDEHADLRRLAREIPPTGALLDLAGVKRVNSIGTREWIAFAQLVADRPIVLDRCPIPFVDQLNAIANFRGNARVRSVMAAFECVSCGAARMEVLDIEALFPDQVIRALPPVACTECSHPMEFDDEPERYFQFIRLLPPR